MAGRADAARAAASRHIDYVQEVFSEVREQAERVARAGRRRD